MNFDSFHPQFASLLDAFQRDARKFLIQWNDPRAREQSTERPVSIDRSLSFNASVRRSEDGYAWYTVTAGAVAALYDISRTLCATEQFVPEIAITGKAMQTRTIRDASHFLDYSELIGSRGEPLPIIPLREIFADPIREAIGFIFLDLIFRFLMMHEQMHFVRGHLHYLYGSNSPGAYDEVPPEPSSTIESADRKALELDADGSALFFMLDTYEGNRHQNIIRPIIARYPEASHLIELFGDVWGWARIAGLAALTVMMLLSLRDKKNLSHPDVQTRMLSLLGTHELYLRNKTDFGGSGRPHPSLFAFFRDVAMVSTTLQTAPPETAALIEWKTLEPSQYRNPACIELRDLQARLTAILPKLR